MSVPPSFFEKHLNLGADEILKALDRGSMGKDFLPAFGQAAIQFNELLWLRKTIERVDSKLYPEVFHLLPPEEAEQYAIKQLQYEGKAGEIIKHLTDLDNEWSIQLTKAVLRFTSTNSYTYHKGFYEQIIHLIPVRIASDLESFAPKEEHLKIMWMNVVEHLRRLLSLKHDTIKAFTE